jgi:RluA family pseudouridine synthase
MLKTLLKHKIVALIGNLRLSDYDYEKLVYFHSKKGLKKAIKKGRVLVNGMPAQTSTWLNPGDEISIIEDDNTNNKSVYKMDIQVVYEDDVLAVVVKPSGLITSGNKHRTLENACQANLKSSTLSAGLQRILPVHRLDAATSGLIIMAKTPDVLNQLNQMMKFNSVSKKYLALAEGLVDLQSIDSPIQGKKSISHIIGSTPIESNKYGPLSFVKVKIDTGRTHQIRKHLAFIGHPIVGDKIYNANFSASAKGLMLHAYQLEFEHPVTFDHLNLVADLPKRFRRFGIDDQSINALL